MPAGPLGFGEGVPWWGAACWERPPGHSLHPLAGHVAGQPHPALVFLEACCQARAAGKAAGPCPQPAGPERAWCGGFEQSGSGQADYVLPSPTLAAPSLGRLLPAVSGSPGRGPTDAGPACPSHCQVFTCSVCQETFRRRMELRVHMVSHTGEMPYKVRLGLSPGSWAKGQPQDPSPWVPPPCSFKEPAFPAHPGPHTFRRGHWSFWGPCFFP